MVSVLVQCPTCSGVDVIKHGKTLLGKQRYLCQNGDCDGSTFIMGYSYNGRLPEIKRQIIDMSLNGSGIRDTARVLKISPSTVIEELKKKIRNSNKSTKRLLNK
jgi:insertion element IS1 protein InsB